MVLFSLALKKPNNEVPQIGDNDSGRLHKLSERSELDPVRHSHLYSTVGRLLGNQDLINAGIDNELEGKLLCGGLARIQEQRICKNQLGNKVIFSDAGVAREHNDEAWLTVKCGKTGMDGLGGHSHNDKNSFELNINGSDFIVDGGCPNYLSSPAERNKFRSTAMHNTIYPAGMEQIEFESGIAGLFSLKEHSETSLYLDPQGRLTGSHSSYGKLHTRTFHLNNKYLKIHDFLKLPVCKFIVFNLHPNDQILNHRLKNSVKSLNLQHSEGIKIELEIFGLDSFTILDGIYSMGYLNPIPAQKLQGKFKANEIVTKISW